MSKNEKHPTLDEVIGRNARRLREKSGRTQDELATALTTFGFRWSRATISAIEGGERGLGIDELVVLAAYWLVPVAELLAGKGEVEVLEQTTARIAYLRHVLTAGEYIKGNPAEEIKSPSLRQLRAQINERRELPAEAEWKAARRLGVSPDAVRAAAEKLWKKNLVMERDLRVKNQSGDHLTGRSLQALRGHVTRRLLVELEPIVKELLDGQR